MKAALAIFTGAPHEHCRQPLTAANDQRYFLKKESRLKSRKAIESLFASGKTFSEFPFRIFYAVAENEDDLKAGFGAGSKNFKRATDRNRIKRLMREAYRLQKNELEHKTVAQETGLHVFFIYIGKELPSYNIISEKMAIVLKRLLKIVHADNQ